VRCENPNLGVADSSVIVEKRSAWIVQWHFPKHYTEIPEQELRPHILPYRWNDRRIFDYMRCLFWNSVLFSPGAILCGVNKPNSRNKDQTAGYMVNAGASLFYGRYGDGYFLIAGLTKDLRITKDKVGSIFVKWTRPAGSRRDNKSGYIVPHGIPHEEKWIWKRGRWSCDSEFCVQ